MQVTKQLQTNPSFIIRNLTRLARFVSEKDLVLESCSISLYCKDVDYRYGDLNSFEKDIPSIKNLEGCMIDLDFSKHKKININLYSSKNTNIRITDENRTDAESLINEIALFLKIKVYSYNPTSVATQKVKDGIKQCVSVLSESEYFHARRSWNITDEKSVQMFLHPILKSHFNDLEDEFQLPRYGSIEYKPDFGIPSLALLIEVKVIRARGDLKKVQKEIIDDSVGYIKSNRKYRKILVYIYNMGNVPIDQRYTKDLEKINPIEKVIVCPSINAQNVK